MKQKSKKKGRPELIHLASDVPRGRMCRASSPTFALIHEEELATTGAAPSLLCLNTTHQHSQDTFPVSVKPKYEKRIQAWNLGTTLMITLNSPTIYEWYWFWKTGKLLKREAESGSWKDLNFTFQEKRKHLFSALYPHILPPGLWTFISKLFSKYLSLGVSIICSPPSSRTVSPEASSPAGRGPTITTAMQLDLSLMVPDETYLSVPHSLCDSVYMQA